MYMRKSGVMAALHKGYKVRRFDGHGLSVSVYHFDVCLKKPSHELFARTLCDDVGHAKVDVNLPHPERSADRACG